jgi:flagellar assembly protein FliH
MSSRSFAPFLDDVGGRPTPSAFRGFGEPEPAPSGPGAPEPVHADEPHPETTGEAQRAFQAGYELGRQETRADVESIAESFVKSLEELAVFRGRLRERYERQLLELALGVARKVVQQEIAERPAIWLGMIRAAVRRAVDRERILVRVPPTLLGFLTQALPELRTVLGDVKELEVLEDPSLPIGGCVIETKFGEVDIGLDTQFEAVERALGSVEG